MDSPSKPKQTGIFLSHSHVDKPFVRRLGQDLIARGFKVWIDEAEILVGESLVKKVTSAIEDMDYVAAIISKHSVHSNWVRHELHQAMNDEISRGTVKVLPLLLDDCDLPPFMKDKLFADFRNDSYENGLEALLRCLQHGRMTSDAQGTAADSEESSELPSWIHEIKERSGIDPSSVAGLPRNARLALLLRCIQRVVEPLLIANWYDGNHMWGVAWYINHECIPLIEKITFRPEIGRYDEIFASQQKFKKLIYDSFDRHDRVIRPKVLNRVVSVISDTLDFALGSNTSFQKALYGTCWVYGVVNPVWPENPIFSSLG